MKKNKRKYKRTCRHNFSFGITSDFSTQVINIIGTYLCTSCIAKTIERGLDTISNVVNHNRLLENQINSLSNDISQLKAETEELKSKAGKKNLSDLLKINDNEEATTEIKTE